MYTEKLNLLTVCVKTNVGKIIVTVNANIFCYRTANTSHKSQTINILNQNIYIKKSQAKVKNSVKMSENKKLSI